MYRFVHLASLGLYTSLETCPRIAGPLAFCSWVVSDFRSHKDQHGPKKYSCPLLGCNHTASGRRSFIAHVVQCERLLSCEYLCPHHGPGEHIERFVDFDALLNYQLNFANYSIQETISYLSTLGLTQPIMEVELPSLLQVGLRPQGAVFDGGTTPVQVPRVAPQMQLSESNYNFGIYSHPYTSFGPAHHQYRPETNIMESFNSHSTPSDFLQRDDPNIRGLACTNQLRDQTIMIGLNMKNAMLNFPQASEIKRDSVNLGHHQTSGATRITTDGAGILIGSTWDATNSGADLFIANPSSSMSEPFEGGAINIEGLEDDFEQQDSADLGNRTAVATYSVQIPPNHFNNAVLASLEHGEALKAYPSNLEAMLQDGQQPFGQQSLSMKHTDRLKLLHVISKLLFCRFAEGNEQFLPSMPPRFLHQLRKEATSSDVMLRIGFEVLRRLFHGLRPETAVELQCFFHTALACAFAWGQASVKEILSTMQAQIFVWARILSSQSERGLFVNSAHCILVDATSTSRRYSQMNVSHPGSESRQYLKIAPSSFQQSSRLFEDAAFLSLGGKHTTMPRGEPQSPSIKCVEGFPDNPLVMMHRLFLESTIILHPSTHLELTK